MFKAHRLLYHSALGSRVIKKFWSDIEEGRIEEGMEMLRYACVPPPQILKARIQGS